MPRVLSSNVIVTKSRKAIEKLFFGDNKIKSLKEKMVNLDEDDLLDSFISSPYKNDGIIRFEFVQSPAAGKGEPKREVRLRVLETRRSLEYFLMNNDPVAKAIATKADELFNELETIQNTEQRLGTISENSSLENIAKSSKYYFSFGSSDNLKEWSGPHAMQLAGAVLRNDDTGNRYVDLTFAPLVGTLKSWSSSFADYTGLDSIYDRLNSITSRSTYVGAEAYIDIGELKVENFRDLNSNLRKLLKRYLALSTSNNNIVIALPMDISFKEGELERIIKKMSLKAALEKTLGNFGIKLLPSIFFESDVKSPNSIKIPDKIAEDTRNSIAKESFSLCMNHTITDSQKTKLIEPIFDFVEGLKSIYSKEFPNQQYTFYEETDMSILRLWEKHEIIPDGNKPTFVFGDVNYISRLLYVDGYKPGDKKSKRKKRTDNESLKFLFGDKFGKKYYDYTEDFVDEFNLDGVLDIDSPIADFTGDNPQEIEFRHNISNPNVIELEYKEDQYLGALVSIQPYPELAKQLPNSLSYNDVQNVAFSTLGEPFIQRMIQSTERMAQKAIGNETLTSEAFKVQILAEPKLKDFLLSRLEKKVLENESLANLDYVSLVNFISLSRFLDNSKNNKENPTEGVKLYTEEEREAYLYLASYNYLKQRMQKVKLTTLPMFGQIQYFRKACKLKGNVNSIIGFTENNKPAPYSGNFTIMGWRHVIEAEESYSSFELVRDSINEDAESGMQTSQTVKEAMIEYLQRQKAILEKSSGGPSYYAGLGSIVLNQLRGVPDLDGLSQYQLNIIANTKRLEEVNALLDNLSK